MKSLIIMFVYPFYSIVQPLRGCVVFGVFRTQDMILSYSGSTPDGVGGFSGLAFRTQDMILSYSGSTPDGVVWLFRVSF